MIAPPMAETARSEPAMFWTGQETEASVVMDDPYFIRRPDASIGKKQFFTGGTEKNLLIPDF